MFNPFHLYFLSVEHYFRMMRAVAIEVSDKSKQLELKK